VPCNTSARFGILCNARHVGHVDVVALADLQVVEHPPVVEAEDRMPVAVLRAAGQEELANPGAVGPDEAVVVFGAAVALDLVPENLSQNPSPPAPFPASGARGEGFGIGSKSPPRPAG
jgi:hypothetical protein